MPCPRWQKLLELNPVATSPDYPAAIALDEEVLLGVGRLPKRETLTTSVGEAEV